MPQMILAAGCSVHSLPGTYPYTWRGCDILWRHFQAHYGTPEALKFYHSGQVHIISSQTGSQQGGSLGTVLFSAPLQPILHKVADSHPQILVFDFADDVILLGPLFHTLPAIDTYNQLLAEANLKLKINPHESINFFPSSATKEYVQPTLTTPQGFAIPCTTDGIKLLGSPIDTFTFASDLFSKIGSKI